MDKRSLRAERIRAARIAAGESRKDVATRLNVSVTTIGNWENAIRSPDIDDIEALAKLYNADPAYLSGITDTPLVELAQQVGSLPAPNNSGDMVINLADIFRAMPAEYAAPEALKALKPCTALDDAISPEISAGAFVLVDDAKQELTAGLMAFAVSEDDKSAVTIRRVRRKVSGDIELYSDNAEQYPTESYTSKEAAKLPVVGRVVWSGSPAK